MYLVNQAISTINTAIRKKKKLTQFDKLNPIYN